MARAQSFRRLVIHPFSLERFGQDRVQAGTPSGRASS
jgi:hypothetical protein